MSSTAFYSGTDWQDSSGPYLNRYFEAADLWPHGTGSTYTDAVKDELAAGLHPVLAIGERIQGQGTASEPQNLTGVVVTYEDANRVLINVADAMIVRQYVANVTGYTGSAASAWATSVDAGTPVYVDDSQALAAGVTLTLSRLNGHDATTSYNPKAGYIMYDQDDYDDSNRGGTSGGLPHSGLSSTATEYFLASVMLTQDSG